MKELNKLNLLFSLGVSACLFIFMFKNSNIAGDLDLFRIAYLLLFAAIVTFCVYSLGDIASETKKVNNEKKNESSNT